MQSKDMMPISITEFIDGISVPVNLYVKLGEDKFVLVAKTGTKTERTQLTSYKEKEVDYVWVEKSEYFKVTQQNVTLAGIVVKKDNLRFANKANIITTAACSIFTQLEHMGISVRLYNSALQVTDATLALMQGHRDLALLLESMSQSNNELLNHSMAVSTLSVMIGVSMGWEKKATLEKLAVGGLLHDIGFKALPPELLKKPLSRMSFEERQLYETHPFQGMKMLRSLAVVPDDVVGIVFEHHENCGGTGYPQGLRDVKIHPLAKVVALADQFVELTLQSLNCPHPKNPKEALALLEQKVGVNFNREVFKALKLVVEGRVLGAA